MDEKKFDDSRVMPYSVSPLRSHIGDQNGLIEAKETHQQPWYTDLTQVPKMVRPPHIHPFPNPVLNQSYQQPSIDVPDTF